MTSSKIKHADVTVIIPAYNEGKNIRGVIEAIIGHGYNVLVIDDGSSDDTETAAREAGAAVEVFSENQGKGAALKHGFTVAREKGNQAVVLMDGDGQHDPDDLNRLIEELSQEGIDMVIGSRKKDFARMPLVRRWTNRFMSRIVSFLARTRIKDTQSGFRALSSSVLQSIELKCSNFEIESEMIIQAGRRGFTISEIPIRAIYGGGEVSSIRPILDTARFFALVLRYLLSRGPKP